MSKIEEQKCLDSVIEYCKKQRGLTKKIGLLLSGNEVDREFKECPDFVKYTPNDTIIGIEHFQVDHFSIEKQDKKIGSQVNKYYNDLNKAQEKFNKTVSESNNVGWTEETANDFAKIVEFSFHNKYTASYGSYIKSFKYSLEKHLKKTDEYIKNLTALTHNKSNIELVFLIDVYSDFSGLFLTDKKGTYKSNVGNAPMFREVVELLENIDKRKIDYVIMRFNSVNYTQQSKIIVVRTGNIKTQLEKQHIKIYEYAGDDYYTRLQGINRNLPSKQQHTIDGDNLNIEIQIRSDDISQADRLKLVLQGFKKALYCKLNNINCATTMLVQMMIELFGDYYLNLLKAKIPVNWYEWRYLMDTQKETMDKKKKAFEKIWFSQEEDENE